MYEFGGDIDFVRIIWGQSRGVRKGQKTFLVAYFSFLWILIGQIQQFFSVLKYIENYTQTGSLVFSKYYELPFPKLCKGSYLHMWIKGISHMEFICFPILYSFYMGNLDFYMTKDCRFPTACFILKQREEKDIIFLNWVLWISCAFTLACAIVLRYVHFKYAYTIKDFLICFPPFRLLYRLWKLTFVNVIWIYLVFEGISYAN